MHGDVWEQTPIRDGARSPRGRFSVMHVCGHHDPPHVTGYWWSDGLLDPAQHDSIPLPRFLEGFRLVEREEFDA
jgi:hypothetical protein